MTTTALAKHGGKCTLGCLCDLPAGWVPPPAGEYPDEMLPNGVNLRVIREAYDWDIDIDGEVHGLTAGDHGFEPTGIKLGPVMPKESA